MTITPMAAFPDKSAAEIIADRNVDDRVARGFGEEWSAFRQGGDSLSREQRVAIFEDYFRIFPWQLLPPGGGVGIDVGCGTGRWSALVAPRVKRLHLLDVSAKALAVARENLKGVHNVIFHVNSVAEIPLPPQSLDFAFSLGVLHHVPDTQRAIRSIADKLKPNAPFLIYLYYSFENRPRWYKALWAASNSARTVISRLPYPLRKAISEIIATLFYWPLARLGALARRLGLPNERMPLSWYADKSFYVLRTDAYDRFATSLEKRFSKAQITQMLADAGFSSISFSDSPPYWCAIGIKSA